MAGHSRWAQVKHKKAGADAKRSAIFSKLGRLISAAAREGGPNPEQNQKLRQAVDQARETGLPKENIERAIGRASATGPEADLLGREYEAYGPHGSAFLILARTDNPHRTTAELKQIIAEYGGKLVESGSVRWMFRRQAVVEIEPAPGAESAELAAIDCGAADTAMESGRVSALVDPARLNSFLQAMSPRGFKTVVIKTVFSPAQTISLDSKARQELERLRSMLENHPDVTAVASNAVPTQEL